MRELGLGVMLVVNSSIKTCREVGDLEPDALFFTDNNWFEDNEELVRDFQGLRFTASRRAKEKFEDLIRIETFHRMDFKVGEPPMRDGRSSGHRAVSLAVMLGAKLVVLLGYDMQIDPDSGRSHCHNDYKNTEGAKAYEQEFIPSFDGWNRGAREVGCEILNATETTALKEFPRVKLSNILTEILGA